MLNEKTAYIVYDGNCPFCSRYVKLLRLRDTIGSIELVDARTTHPVVALLDEKGIDLDEGMALVQGGQIFSGHDCINRLALMSTRYGAFNKINYFVFRNPSLSALLYPVLRTSRNLTLKFLGRAKIGDNQLSTKSKP